MKFAIDRYGIGTEIEVDADDFENKYYIPQRLSRFYCPECNEIVFFRKKGGNHPNQFYHKGKTSITPECDNRVDGSSNLTISQRVGLPLFITQIGMRYFQLNIGFPALGIKPLENAAKNDCIVKIVSHQQYSLIRVNQSNFLSDNTTLIPINFTPTDGSNYSILIDGKTKLFELQKKWSDYADGFETNGAIFSYSETDCKKIRRGDCIATNRNYYAVTNNSFLNHPLINQTQVGKLILNKTEYKVIKFFIDVSIDNKKDFEYIASKIKSDYGVVLLECQPELIPIWPPVVKQDYLIPVKNESNVICAVSSGNVEPAVYTYSGSIVYKKDLKTVSNGVHIVEFAIEEHPTTLSVDRKYAGREVTFISRNLHHSNYTYDFSFIGSSGEKIELSQISESIVSKGFVIESNSKFDLYLGTSEMVYKHFSVREQQTTITENHGITEISLIIDSSVYDCIRFSKDIAFNADIKNLSQTIIASARGQLIPIPIWVNHILQYLKNNQYEQLYQAIIETMVNGKLHIETIRQLRLFDLSSRISNN